MYFPEPNHETCGLKCRTSYLQHAFLSSMVLAEY